MATITNLHVHPEATGTPEDGSDWMHAYRSIGSGLFAASGFNNPINLYIESGVYFETLYYPNPSGNFLTLIGGCIINATNNTSIGGEHEAWTQVADLYSLSTNSGILFLDGVWASGLFFASGHHDFNAVDCKASGSANATGFIGKDVPYLSLSNFDAFGKTIGVHVTNCSGNLNVTASGCSNYGLYVASGAIDSIAGSKLLDNTTGLYVYQNLLSEMKLSDFAGRTLIDSDVGVYFHSGRLSCEYATIHGYSGFIGSFASGDINYSILAGSGFPGISGVNSAALTVSGSCLYDYAGGSTNKGVTVISSISQNPLFVNHSAGDFRLQAFGTHPGAYSSPCIGRGGCRRSADQVTEVNANSIRVWQGGEKMDANRLLSSGLVYMMGDPIGTVIYLQSGVLDWGTPPEVSVEFSFKRETEENVAGIQSYALESGAQHPYPNDYKIILKYDENTGKNNTYLKPMTVIPFDSVIEPNNTAVAIRNITKNDVTVKALHNVIAASNDPENFSKDDVEINGVSWVLEQNNHYLDKVDSVTGKRIRRYALFAPTLPPKGKYKTYSMTIIPSGLVLKSETDSGYEFITDRFYETNAVTPSTKIVHIRNRDGSVPWLPYDMHKDPVSGSLYRDPRSIYAYGDKLLILCAESYDSDFAKVMTASGAYPSGQWSSLYVTDTTTPDFNRNMPSGTLLYGPRCPMDVTATDDGRLLIIDASGVVYRFVPRYDYAYIENVDRNKSTLMFREYYDGGVYL